MKLICYHCGNRHSGVEGLVEIKSAPIPKFANGTSQETMQPNKLYKCYNCGFAFKPVKIEEKKVEVEIKRQEVPEGDAYFKMFENEVLKSQRKKPKP